MHRSYILVLFSVSIAYNHHHCTCLEWPSPDRSSHEVKPSRSSKRKSDHHLDRKCDNDRDRDLDPDYGYPDHDLHHHHYHHPKSSSRRSSELLTMTSFATAGAEVADRKHKASVFSLISFLKMKSPRRESSSRRLRLNRPENRRLLHITSQFRMGIMTITNRRDQGRSFQWVEEESSDAEWHFKLRPSR